MNPAHPRTNARIMNRRWLFAAIAAACAGLLGFGYYLEHARGLEPCPLCMVQRLCFYALLACGLVAAVHGAGRRGTRVYAGLTLAFAVFGAGIAGRQIWLQHLPADAVPACGPGLDFMLDVMPLTEVITTVLAGSGECAEVVWRFLGLSIPQWSILAFIALAAAALIALLRPGDGRPGPQAPETASV